MKDKCLMLLSPLGSHSHLPDPYIISDMKPDGSLDVLKLDSRVNTISAMGANISREFPFWIDSERALETLTPFHFSGDDIIFHDNFFEIHRIRAIKHREKNVRYCYSQADGCGAKGIMGTWNPWRKYRRFFYDRDARKNYLLYLDRIFRTFEGDLKPWVYFDQCNEIEITPDELNGKMGADKISFLIDSFVHMIKSGIDPHQILLAIDYYQKEKIGYYGTLYRRFREGVCAKLGNDWADWIKSKCISPIHRAKLPLVRSLFGEDTQDPGDDASPGGRRNMCFSADGWRPRPTRELFQQMASHVLEVKKNSAKRGRISFEVIYGKEKTDPLDSFLGAEGAYFNRFGHHLENYRDGSTPPAPPPGPSLEERIAELERWRQKVEGK